MRTNPWLGMGWGYDLAENFERLYYPEGNDEFAARSPHSIFVTLFGRTGAVGLIAFAAVTGAILVRSVKSIRAKRESAYLWAAVLVILSSSAFAVVLEGPMGAVIFWAMLGLASSYDIAENGMARDDTPSGPQT
jgi:O-antigen ligase